MRPLRIRAWDGAVAYPRTWDAMQGFTAQRTEDTEDELWLLEHEPVYTRGRNAHEAAPDGSIAVVDSDRGGDITYHGPGQLVAYTLFDLARASLGVRQLVFGLEAAVIASLAGFGITGERRAGAPGVYVGGAKIASLGLRIRGGRSYHGLALNVAMDLEPFARIAPCGYRGLAVTQIADCGGPRDMTVVAQTLTRELCSHFGYIPLEDNQHDGGRYERQRSALPERDRNDPPCGRTRDTASNA